MLPTRLSLAASLVLLLATSAFAAPLSSLQAMISHAPIPGGVPLVAAGAAADVYVDSDDFKLANIAAGLFCDDVQSVTGIKPALHHNPTELSKQAVIIGVIGHSALIDQLVASGRLDVHDVKDQWETYTIQVLHNVLPNVASAVVIAGSDRRGAAYGVFDLSHAIGVSPWYWWADVLPAHQDTLIIKTAQVKEGPPSVKYRGIFINDEDWGLEPWAAKTFEKEQGNIGPKTYAKVFELILRLRGDYLWPAMHPVSTEFARIPANITLADDWGIVMGASHTEAMNRNNVLWPQEGTGQWRYDTNHDNVMAYWEAWAKLRGRYEAVWTLGIRGVHDSAMLGPPDAPGKIKIVETAIADQRELLKKYVNPDLSKVPQLFAPYKEVLALYQRGLKVPEDVTLLWTDDNFGYIRQLSTPAEQARPGASGIYYHISYLGRPRSYTWLNTTPPALIWEEMSKAYDYGANRVWVCNVGDIKPGEIGMDFWFRLGWNINAYDNESVSSYLADWAGDTFGPDYADQIAAVMNDYYRLGFTRKPEAMDADSFNATERADRLARYNAILAKAQNISDSLPPVQRDAFYELVLYPVKMCALVNQAYFTSGAQRKEAESQIAAGTDYYNTTLAAGKWNGIMTERGNTNPSYEFRYPTIPAKAPPAPPASDTIVSIAAQHFSRDIPENGATWKPIAGLGREFDSLAVFPTTTPSIDKPDLIPDHSAELDYDFTFPQAGPVHVTVYAIPTHRINPLRGLRYAVAMDNHDLKIVDFEQPADNNKAWNQNVIRNAAITTTDHVIAGGGQHTLKIYMVDPGVAIEKIVISQEALPPSELGPPETTKLMKSQ